MKILDVPQSGSVAGTTSSRNRYGQYRRTRAIPVNPATDRQVVARSRLTELAISWRGLTEPQRQSWREFAANHPRTDSLGQTYFQTGLQAYIGINSAGREMGLADILTAPAVQDPFDFALEEITFEVSGEGIEELQLEFAPTPMPANSRVIVYAGRPVSQGVTFFNDWRFLDVIPPAEVTPFEPAAAYAAKFGVPAVGQQVFFKAAPYVGHYPVGGGATGAVTVAAAA